MGRKGLVVIVAGVAVAFVISGCSTMPKKVKEEISGLKTKVDTLESRVDTVESKQAEVEKVTTEQSQVIEQLKTEAQPTVKTNVSVKSRDEAVQVSNTSTKDIQRCLKNAGFYDGSIDGIRGTQTKRAIRAFQSANGLRADGVVGPKTWDILSKYAGGGHAAAAAGSAGGSSESAE